MCGIVGVMSPTAMSVQMKEFFHDLLLHDVVRGPHATGVAAIDTMDRKLTVMKKAVPSYVFLQDKEQMEPLFEFKHNFNIYIGHNRFATSGARDVDANAHPFVHGDIVGVHNGSLRNQKLLDNHEKFVVDSDNLYNHLDRNGLDHTITKTDGAYSLVWYNKEDNSLNFIRNDERPMAIGKLSNGCWVWASEIEMLRWLVTRHKSLSWATYKENGVDYNLCHKLEPMTHMKFEFADKTRTIPTPRLSKKTEPVFPRQAYNMGYSWDDYSGNTSRPRQSTSQVSVTGNTTYGKRIKDVLGQFLVGAAINSAIEVEYMGNATEASRTGYVAKLVLFKYQSKNGKVVVFHQYMHDQSFTKDWTEKDIGRRVYGEISSVCEIQPTTFACVKNEELNSTLQLTALTFTKPARHYPYCDDKDVDVAAMMKEEAAKAKEGESQNVLPFREAQQKTTEITQTQTGSPNSVTPNVSLAELAGPRPETLAAKIDRITFEMDEAERKAVKEQTQSFMDKRIFLGNGWMKQSEFIEACTLNAARCAECARSLANINPQGIYLYTHFDRDTGTNHDYLHCSRRCMQQNKDECDLIDQDYDQRYGGQDD